MLGVIQTGNRELIELKTKLKTAQEASLAKIDEESIRYQDQIRAVLNKNIELSKELEEYKVENCQLAQ